MTRVVTGKKPTLDESSESSTNDMRYIHYEMHSMGDAFDIRESHIHSSPEYQMHSIAEVRTGSFYERALLAHAAKRAGQRKRSEGHSRKLNFVPLEILCLKSEEKSY